MRRYFARSAAALVMAGLACAAPARAQTPADPASQTKTDTASEKAAKEASGQTMTSTLPEHTVLSRQSLIVRGQRGAAAPLPGTATESAAAKPRGLHLNAGPLRSHPGCQTGYTNIGGQPARAGELYTSLGQRACGGH